MLPVASTSTAIQSSHPSIEPVFSEELIYGILSRLNRYELDTCSLVSHRFFFITWTLKFWDESKKTDFKSNENDFWPIKNGWVIKIALKVITLKVLGTAQRGADPSHLQIALNEVKVRRIAVLQSAFNSVDDINSHPNFLHTLIEGVSKLDLTVAKTWMSQIAPSFKDPFWHIKAFLIVAKEDENLDFGLLDERARKELPKMKKALEAFKKREHWYVFDDALQKINFCLQGINQLEVESVKKEAKDDPKTAVKRAKSIKDPYYRCIALLSVFREQQESDPKSAQKTLQMAKKSIKCDAALAEFAIEEAKIDLKTAVQTARYC